MKATMAVIILLTLVPLIGSSQHYKNVQPNIEKIIQIASFDKLIVDARVNILLVENANAFIQVKGYSDFVEGISIFQYQGEVRVKSRGGDTSRTNQVLINVSNLRKLIVEQESVITSSGSLQSEKLNILIRAECLIRIRNQGSTSVQQDEKFDVETTYTQQMGNNGK